MDIQTSLSLEFTNCQRMHVMFFEDENINDIHRVVKPDNPKEHPFDLDPVPLPNSNGDNAIDGEVTILNRNDINLDLKEGPISNTGGSIVYCEELDNLVAPSAVQHFKKVRKGVKNDSVTKALDRIALENEANMASSSKGNSYTWSNNQEGEGQIWERLDRCLVNGLAMSFYPNLEVQHLARFCSDHCPLLLNLNGACSRRKGIFRFLGSWTEHVNFQDIVKDTWADKAHINPLLNFSLKLKKLRGVLRKWNWEKFGDINLKVRHLTQRVVEMENDIQLGRNGASRDAVTKVKEELSCFLRYQFAILEEKSKHKWIMEGGRNSAFFHASIKARRICNNMKLLMEDGTYSEDAKTIGTHAVTYFQRLFGGFSSNADEMVEDLIQPLISTEQNAYLTHLPEEEEIKATVTSMDPTSSPGPDGFTGKFFRSYWDIIKFDLVEAVQGFFKGLQLPNLISSAHIILLPKVKNAVNFDKVSPITLCNFFHKILSQILNDRLNSVLPRLISMEQAGFVEGRNIHESIGLAHDLVNDINNKSYGGNVVIKLDMSKAYDRVSIHMLSILPVPKVVLNGIERLMRNFIWDRGSSTRHHWINWDLICKPKDEGGLGLRKLTEVKECMLSKLACRFMLNNTIWAKYSRDKYLYSSYSSAIWTALKPFILKLRRDSFWEIGRGDIQVTHYSEWFGVRLPKEASNNIKGIWKKWCPSSIGNTLSIAVNNFRCGGILRDTSGTFKFGFKVVLECDDIYEGLISSLLLIRVEGWQLSCIQISHRHIHLLGADTYAGNRDRYGRWRETRKLLNKAKIMHVPAELNDAAIALCFQNTDDRVFYNLRDLPKAVRLALISDYIRLPIWCRLKRKDPADEEGNDDRPRVLRPGSPVRHNGTLG
ncbi:hypothetical protein QQ045_032859 [Rhodiola kirilowii]